MADLVIRPSIKGIILWYVLADVMFLVAFIYIWDRQSGLSQIWPYLALPVLLNIWTGLRHVRLNSRRLTLQKDILRFEDGLISKTQRNIILDKVRDVNISQTFGQRLVGVGDLSVEALGESGNISLENVDRPRQVADAILEAMRQSRQSNR